MVLEVDHDHNLEELGSFIPGVDIILAEGYKRGEAPKVEIFRAEIHDKPFCMDDGYLMAIVTDGDVDLDVPRFRTDDVRGLAVFIMERFGPVLV